MSELQHCRRVIRWKNKTTFPVNRSTSENIMYHFEMLKVFRLTWACWRVCLLSSVQDPFRGRVHSVFSEHMTSCQSFVLCLSDRAMDNDIIISDPVEAGKHWHRLNLLQPQQTLFLQWESVTVPVWCKHILQGHFSLVVPCFYSVPSLGVCFNSV